MTTPIPIYTTDPATDVRPATMDMHERARFEAAAVAAKRRLPGAIGELVATELLWWARFGYRLAAEGPARRAVDQLLAP